MANLELIEYYLYRINNSFKIELSETADGYIADLYYGDEEIENYLGTGFTIKLAVTDIQEDPVDNSVGFVLHLISCTAPSLDINGDTRSPYFTAEMYAELGRVLGDFFHDIQLDEEVWIEQ
jgi:hypothetical protein